MLSSVSGELFVMAEKILDSKAYNQVQTNVTWETCTMRSWLNNDFYNTAFSSTEKLQINTSTVVNANNPWRGTNGGNNTSDKLFFLSYADTINTSYGFSSSYSSSDTARRAQGTDFSKSGGLYVTTSSSYLGNSNWWLRSPGDLPSNAGLVYYDGYVHYNYYYVNFPYVGVRPAFKLHLPSVIFTSKPGSNSIVDYENGVIYGLDTGISSLQDYVDVEPGYEISFVASQNGFGTGTVVNGLYRGEVEKSYKIIIFGDVNGDGNIDSIDAGVTVDVENYLTGWDPIADAAYIKAGDLNGDGNTDSIDAGIMTDYENHFLGVNQVTGLAAVKTEIEGAAAITGTAKYGATLTADITDILPTGATLSYSWKRAAAIVGTGSSYTLVAEDIGKTITVTVTGFNLFEGSIRSTAVIPQKADRAAPAAPVLNVKTPYTVNLKHVEGQEYKVEGGEWQASAEFTGLSPNTAYKFYTRVAETETHFASPASTARTVTTYSNTVTGTVTISGTSAYGKTLSANPNLNPSVATFSYHWYRGDTAIGDNQTYTLLVEDIGQQITCAIIATGDYTGTITSAAVVSTKATAAVPSAPVLLSATSSSITLTALPGQEYRIEDGEWQLGGEFAGLSPNKTYNFYTRIAETDTHYASSASAALSVMTNKAAITGAVVIAGNPGIGNTLTADVTGIFPADATLSYKWKSGDVQVGTDSTYTFMELDLDTPITVTVTGTGDYEGSITSQPVSKNRAALTGTVVITGTPSVGNTLTADISALFPAEATLTYKWRSDGVKVSTDSTYTLITTDLGTAITVTVTGIEEYKGSKTSQAVLIN